MKIFQLSFCSFFLIVLLVFNCVVLWSENRDLTVSTFLPFHSLIFTITYSVLPISSGTLLIYALYLFFLTSVFLPFVMHFTSFFGLSCTTLFSVVFKILFNSCMEVLTLITVFLFKVLLALFSNLLGHFLQSRP